MLSTMEFGKVHLELVQLIIRSHNRYVLDTKVGEVGGVDMNGG